MYRDGLMCATCRGEKVVKNIVEGEGKYILCPKCDGTGYVMNSEKLKEGQGNKKPVLLKG